jgi:hypothetical protein
MVRRRALSGVVTLAVLAVVGPMFRASASGPSRTQGREAGVGPARYLEIFYSSPVLVRAGERVRMPVDVVCATAGGRACGATVTLGTQVGSESWRLVSTPSASGLQFDLTGPANRAVASSPSGTVSFFIRAHATGRTVMLPPGGTAAPLRFFVTRHLPSATTPRISFGRVRAGRAVLSLPWGSGPRRAGLELSRQSPTIGPSGFDVDDRGRVYLLDSLQKRAAAFDRGRLVRSTPLGVSARALMSVGPGRAAFVVDRVGSSVRSTRVGAAGARASVTIGLGMPAVVRVVDGRAYALVLPLDAWVPMAGSSRHEAGPPTVGLPSGGDIELVRVGREDRLRVGLVVGSDVRNAVELRPAKGLAFGDVALAESDGRGGYWLAVRVVRYAPTPDDQYQIIHVNGTRVLSTFATPSRSFAMAPPLARFVIGKDGNLYQMTSSPEGLRILRFDLKEER